MAPRTQADQDMPTGTSMKRILFVDDEPAVLEGLRNLLRKQRRQWDMAFALGGKAALEELEKEPFDVVVSDMRMPGMDGAELLRQVKDRYPGVARVVLSGHADQDLVGRALPVAQQYLSKPCDGEVMRGVIERVCELQALVAGTAVRDIVGRLDKLPSIPKTYWLLTRAIEDPETCTEDIARIVQTDPAMCAKVLQLVNSAYFGMSRPLSSILHAIGYLGLDLLKGLALTLNVFAATEGRAMAGVSFEKIQQGSILTARLAKQFVLADPKEADVAFTGGMVHDIGIIILALTMPEKFGEVMKMTAESKRPVHEIEREHIGATHAEVGGYLLGLWGLPLPIVEAAVYHHSLPQTPRTRMDAPLAVHVADALADQALAAAAGEPYEERIDMAALEAAGVRANLPQWRELAGREVRAMAPRAEL
ncbi:MAG TPA: HDOD domain-containing protein [Candidatus Acidoferrum sp.]|nr:HDOD domain-containing protein [Candidatus Acidoferrum sp.]